LPLPLAPEAIVSQAALLVAVQLQPALAVTVTVPVVAAVDVRFEETGEIVNVQGVPGCTTVNV
jgi:hypothetical protein